MHDLRALVVDDSKVGRVTMMKKLEAMGLKVDLAESGQIALDYLARQQPDVIFMDHMMPDMDGFETTRRIKAAPATRDIPVIIVSGNDEAGFIEAARAAGAIDAIDKPPANEVLEALLAALPSRVMMAAAPAPALDMAEVHALVAGLVTEAMAPLREAVMSEVGRRLAAAMADIQRAQAATEAATEVASKTAAETLANHLQTLEQRLQPLEAAVARPLPDIAALRSEIGQHVEHRMEQRIASGLAESQARSEALAPQLENLRHAALEMRSRLDELAAQAAQKGAMTDSRLNVFDEDMARISRDLQALAAARAEPGESRQSLSESRVRELVAEALNQFQPVVEKPAATPPATPTSSHTEIAELRAGLKTLTRLTAIGGALLLAAIGGLLIWG